MSPENSRFSLRSRIAPFLALAGIDSAIGQILLSKIWTLLAGPLTIFLIGRFMEPRVQGFYYTFNSLIALNIFLELGLETVLMQFASHERAHLEWNQTGVLVGAGNAKSRLAALLRQSMRWYGIAALLVCITTLPTGLYFFARNAHTSAGVNWKGPWALLSLMSALNLCTVPLFALLEGCGRVSTMISIRFAQGVFSSLMFWGALMLKLSLFAAPILQGTNVAVAVICFWVLFRRCLSDLFRVDTLSSGFSWWVELWPFQWRVAVTSLSSYFAFQLFNPILFAYRGPVDAGKMGMSMTLVQALQITCSSWVVTKACPFGVLIARKQYHELDKLFVTALVQASTLYGIGAATVYLAILYLNHSWPAIAGRFLDPPSISLLLGCSAINLLIFAEVIYLRAHKREPLLWTSLASAAAIALSIWLLGRSHGARGMILGYFAVNLTINLGFSTAVFWRKRREWHAPSGFNIAHDSQSAGAIAD